VFPSAAYCSVGCSQSMFVPVPLIDQVVTAPDRVGSTMGIVSDEMCSEA
jgi:hypothetical protein